jgi:hypothetical protein
MAGDIDLIWGKREGKYFCEGDWTGIQLICPSGRFIESAQQIGSCAQAMLEKNFCA